MPYEEFIEWQAYFEMQLEAQKQQAKKQKRNGRK